MGAETLRASSGYFPGLDATARSFVSTEDAKLVRGCLRDDAQAVRGAGGPFPGRGVRPVLPAAAPPAGRRGRDAGSVPPRLPQPARLGRRPTAAAVDHGHHRQPLPDLDDPAVAPAGVGRLPARHGGRAAGRTIPPSWSARSTTPWRSCAWEYRTVFVLFHEQGRPYEEIAQALGRPVGTVKTWLHRARLEILDRLRKRGMVPEENAEQPPRPPSPWGRGRGAGGVKRT